MARLEIEPITGARLLARYVGGPEGATAELVIPTLQGELDWRNSIKAIKCPWLLLSGSCRHAAVIAKHGVEHKCPIMSGKVCTAKRIETLSRF
jgi:hypothetical protein